MIAQVFDLTGCTSAKDERRSVGAFVDRFRWTKAVPCGIFNPSTLPMPNISLLLTDDWDCELSPLDGVLLSGFDLWDFITADIRDTMEAVRDLGAGGVDAVLLVPTEVVGALLTGVDVAMVCLMALLSAGLVSMSPACMLHLSVALKMSSSILALILSMSSSAMVLVISSSNWM